MFLGGLVNKVHHVYTNTVNQLNMVYRARNIKPSSIKNSQSGSLRFAITTDVSKARSMAEASIVVWLNKSLRRDIQEDIGKMGTKIVKDIVSPIRRTGGFENSWKYKLGSGGDSVTIYSDHKAATSLQRGIKRVGSTQDLVKWLKTKKEHSGKRDVELKRLAFNIKRKIDRGDSPGSTSTLKYLTPTGDRSFDYITKATEQIEKELNIFIKGL